MYILRPLPSYPVMDATIEHGRNLIQKRRPDKSIEQENNRFDLLRNEK